MIINFKNQKRTSNPFTLKNFKIHSMKKLKLMLMLLVISFSLVAQSNFFVEAGAGIPEFYNIGLGYQYSSFGSVDLTYGSDLKVLDGDLFYLLTLNHAFYFGKIGEKANRKLWSFNVGLTTNFFNNDHEEGYKLYLSGWFGREVVISQNILIKPGLGVFNSVYSKINIKDGKYEGAKLLPVYAKFGITLIYNV